MEVVWRDLIVVGGRGGHVEFAPQGVNVLLRVRHAGILHEVVAHSRVRAVCAEQEIKRDFNLLGSAGRVLGLRGILCMVLSDVAVLLLLEPGFVVFQIGAGELVIEEEFDIRQIIQLVEKAFVESCAVDGAYKLRR